MPPAPPTAATRTVRQTLELLDEPFAELSASISRGEYALWLGSAISRERVAALNGVLSRIIEFLRVRVTPDASCAYRRALNQVIDIASPSDEERGRISFSESSATWPDLPVLLRRLAEKYSMVLNITVEGQPNADYLLWDAADFVDTFSSQEPDAEHLCIGILVLEGVVSDLVSANWDGLLEQGIRELGYTLDVYRICVTGSDFRGPAPAATLLKFHGCAVRAIEDEVNYRPLLIARWSQIVGWSENIAFAAMKHALVGIAAQKRTLMIGMSAQDPNIQSLFQSARALTVWPWNTTPPAHVFAEQTLGPGQRTILEISYGADFHPNQGQILSKSCIQAYGKSLLCALVLKVIATKCSAMLRRTSAPGLSEADFIELDRGVKRIRNLAADAAGADILSYVRKLIRHMSRVKSALQDGHGPVDSVLPYRPINNRHDIANDPNLAATGQHEAACGVALLGLGDEDAHWVLTLDGSMDNEIGAVKINTGAGEARAIFVANSNVDLKLFNDGAYKADDGSAIILHSSPIIAPQQRSPSRPLGRTGRQAAAHVDLAQLLGNAAGVADLRRRFREVIGL